MIKIQRISKPAQLTDDEQRKLTDEFLKDNSKAVWNKTYIRKELLKMTHNKCIYCESLVGLGHKEMHVDHFHPKGLYPNEVIEWENLLPSCPHCNKSKSNHDTMNRPIVNPCDIEPRVQFYIKDYRYKSKDPSYDSIGRRTIEVLGLNDTDDCVKIRFSIGENLNKEIENLFLLAKENQENLYADIRKKNRIVKGCKEVLKQCTGMAEFGACMSTIVHGNDDYLALRNLIIELNLWDDELEELQNLSDEIRLNK